MKKNRSITQGDKLHNNPNYGLTSIVIGAYDKFTLCVGKYAFVPCNKIPNGYLEWLITTEISDDDKAIINKYLSSK